MNVNNRKVFYEDEEMEQLSFTRIILLVIYFVVLIAILYKIDFVGNELYRNKYVLFAIFVYIMFGIYVDWVSKMVYYTKMKISHIFDNDVPRNVYVSM
jgi:magnesium-transporting ATPase (P-type)